ncbi:MAG: NUDIX hydrolase [Acidimicrobiales bacterium]
MSAPSFLQAGDPRLQRSSWLGDAWAAIAPVDHDDLRETRDRMRRLLEERPQPLDRSERPGHLTGSAFVVDASAQRTLMLFHTKLQIWVQPGGHADGDANLPAVALREAQEETGIDGLRIWPIALDLDIHRVDPPNEDAHDHFDVRFLVIAPDDAVLAANHESQDQRWVRADQLAALGVDEGLQRMARRGFALAGRQLAG